MPFNRDLIESGCALKTFDGDLSVLERVIDWTVTKPGFSDQKCMAIKVVPVSNKVSPDQRMGVGTTKQRRHIKEVVYGDNTDDLSAVPEAETCNHLVHKQVVEVSAVASGFCLRHIAEDMDSISHVVQQSTRVETLLHSFCPVVQATSMQLQLSTYESCRAARSVKDVVYGEIDFDRQCGQAGQSHNRFETCDTPQIPVKHFKSCMRELCSSTESVPHASPQQMPAEVSHAHWRSCVHGF